MKRTLEQDYHLQRRGAEYRNINFLLTFKQWLKIWGQSGQLKNRGRCGHQYVMARYGDKGPYAVGNVKIITQSENLSEGHSGLIFSEETKAKMRTAATGRKKTEETRHKLSSALKGRIISPQHRAALSAATKAAQAKMRAEGRHIGRPKRKYL